MIIVGLDFETANAQRNSACQIGLVVLEDGREVDRYTSLIKPPGPFHPVNVSIHGIGPRHVARAPAFAEIWPDVLPRLAAGRRVFAHNAAFDRSVLLRSLEHCGLPAPAISIECSVKLARTHLPTLPNHRLPTVCAALGIPLTGHHDALADARAAALVAWAMLRPKQAVPAAPASPAVAPVRRRKP